MNAIETKLFNLCKIADERPAVYRAQIVAGIYIRNKQIAIGFNSYKSHPFQARFGKHEESIYLHAETDAIKNALKILDVHDMKKCSLYISRMKWEEGDNSKRIQGLAKPCEGCQRAIATFDIENVFYTLDDEGWEML